MDIADVIYNFELIGTFAFAVTGALAATYKKMDIFGMFVLAVVTASGGGTLRSVMIGDYPIPFLANASYLAVATLATLFVFFFRHYFAKHRRTVLVFDAFGLGIFLSIGMNIALSNNYSYWAAVFLGVITAAFGGVIRDVLAGEVPMIFRKELYATAAILGGLVYVFLDWVQFSEQFTMLVAAFVVFGLRLVALKYRLSLPR